MVQDNLDAWIQAIDADLGRPKAETLPAETGLIVERCLISADKLEEWTTPEVLTDIVPDWQKSWKPTIYKEAKGVVLIIGPWNFPMVLTLQPLIGAIAAGCCAAVKPSEIGSNYSNLLAKLLPLYLDQSAYRVILGDAEVTSKALELPWDHGSGRVGRIIASAAAQHLTPVTLELGGKSPVIIAADCDIELAAKRILWGKITNSGQICASPDHVYIVRERLASFVDALTKCYADFFPNGVLGTKTMGHIINKTHFHRLTKLLERTKGKVVLGGKNDGHLSIEPTVVIDVGVDDSLMEEELFGPILPVIPVDSVDEAISSIRRGPHPLTIYAFTQNDATKRKIFENTLSGVMTFNETFQTLSVNELPFGGVGASGYGRQGLKNTFDTFTYLRSSIDMPKEAEPSLDARYPPFTEEKINIVSETSLLQIPPSSNPFAKWHWKRVEAAQQWTVRMRATLDARALKPFTKALVCLSKYGEELSIQATPDTLTLSSTNSSYSAYGHFKFNKYFFAKYSLPPGESIEAPQVTGQLLTKSLLSVLRHRNVDKMVNRCELSIVGSDGQEDEQDTLEGRLIVRLHCKHGKPSISTELSVSVEEFDTYDVYEFPAVIAFHLREFMATILFADSLGLSLGIRFTESVNPVFIEVEGDSYETLFVISTNHASGQEHGSGQGQSSRSNKRERNGASVGPSRYKRPMRAAQREHMAFDRPAPTPLPAASSSQWEDRRPPRTAPKEPLFLPTSSQLTTGSGPLQDSGLGGEEMGQHEFVAPAEGIGSQGSHTAAYPRHSLIPEIATIARESPGYPDSDNRTDSLELIEDVEMAASQVYSPTSNKDFRPLFED
ncbi:hypothetical protein ONZ45_g8071 [Pleurotus djamor]|nr:hypothetical protein ONZ45_g8071 [Pleurotus djamor]